MLQRSILWIMILAVFPVVGLGCEMNKNERSSALIGQLLLKPAANVVLTDQDQLSTAYVHALQQSLNEQAKFSVQLKYLRPMSLGAHVFKLAPPLTRDQAAQAGDILSELDAVEYAEPDYPRHRRR